MASIFGSRWKSQQGDILDEKKRETKNFIQWCFKLDKVSDSQYDRAFEKIEYRAKQAAREDRIPWPPSYAEFLGYCESSANSHMYQNYNAYPLALPEPKADKDKRRAKGMEECKNILDMFE